MIQTCECSCTPATEYCDGSRPSFYTDPTKAAYMWKKLQERAYAGGRQAQRELVVDPPWVPSNNDWSVRSRALTLPSLQMYHLYFGVHLNGLHVISAK